MKEISSDSIKKLAKFPYIKKYYGPHLKRLTHDHPLIRHLNCNYYLFEFSLEKIDIMLRSLDCWKDINQIIRESKNSTQFFDALSEIKVAAVLIDRVSSIKKLPEQGNSPMPDFEIQIDGQVITIEVKRIGDKLPRNPQKNCENDEKNLNKGIVQIIDDIKTIKNAVLNSIKKHQYREGIPHIIIIDRVESDECEDTFYLKPDETEFNECSHLSGIVCFYDYDPKNKRLKKPDWIFYENPHAEKTIQIKKKVLDKLEMKIFDRRMFC